MTSQETVLVNMFKHKKQKQQLLGHYEYDDIVINEEKGNYLKCMSCGTINGEEIGNGLIVI